MPNTDAPDAGCFALVGLVVCASFIALVVGILIGMTWG